MLTGHLHIFFDEISIQDLCSFLNQVVSFCCCWVLRVLCTFWVLTYQIYDLHIFSHAVVCLLFYLYFLINNLLNSFMKSNWSIFSFLACVKSKKLLPNPMSWCFLLRVLYFIFRALIRWELIFWCIWCLARVQLHSCTCGYSIFLTSFVEKTVLSPLNCLGILVKGHFLINVSVYFWNFYSITLVCMSIFMPVLHCSDYCSFIISFEIRKRECFSFVVPFLINLVIQGPLRVHVNLRFFCCSLFFWDSHDPYVGHLDGVPQVCFT